MKTTATWLSIFALFLVVFAGAVAHAGPPGMQDPRMMSGIPRPDSNIEGGTITVRCLNGTFDDPAVGAEVSLELTAADGTTKATKTATTVAPKGRATFDGLDDFAGGVAIAKVTLDGEALKSQPILVNPQTGTAVLLVKGASSTGADAPPGTPTGPGGPPHGAGGGEGAHGMPALREGTPFALPPADDGEQRAEGTLIVGIIEPGNGAPDPRVDVPVTLEIRQPDDAEDVAPTTRATKTDAEGRAAFSELSPPNLPAGTKFTVVVQIEPGTAPRRSKTFEMPGPAMAMIFTPSGRLDATGPPGPTGGGPGSAPSGGPPPSQRRALPPPMPATNLKAGVVEVAVVDADDRPVKDQTVTLIKRDLTGRNVDYDAKTNAMGIARFDDIDGRSDAFYTVATTYDGAPYQSGFFELLDTMGTRAALRVFPTTDDPRLVRSAVQFELRPLENDFVQVIQVYEVFVEGDRAYWPRGGMRIYGAEGSRNLKVLPSAQRWLEEKDSAPFAKLAEPLEPGRIVELSIAYVLEHDGSVTVDWDAPFPVIQGMAVLGDELSLDAGASGPGERPPHDPAKGEEPPEVKFYPLEVGEFAAGPCELAADGAGGDDFVCPPLLRPFAGAPVSLTVSGLTTTAKWDEWVAIGLGAFLVVVVGVSLLLRPRVDRRRALEYRRDLLLHALHQHDGSRPPGGASTAEHAARREELVVALDQIYRQLDVLGDERASSTLR